MLSLYVAVVASASSFLAAGWVVPAVVCAALGVLILFRKEAVWVHHRVRRPHA